MDPQSRSGRPPAPAHRLRRLGRWLLFLVLASFAGLNVVAYFHAAAMTRFVDSGTRTLKPNQLSPLQKVWVLLTGVRIPRPANAQDPASLGLEFQAVRFPAEGFQLEAWSILGPAPTGTVYLFHGYGTSKASLLPEAQQFHQLGLDVYLIDFHGSGGSSGSDTSIGFREAAEVAAAVRQLPRRESAQKFLLYGQSMGAAAILRALATEDLQPAGILLEGPFDNLLHTASHRFEMMGVPPFPSAWLLVFWGGFQQGFDGFAHNPADYARSVRCPTLLIHGKKDPMVTEEEAHRILDNLQGPKTFDLFPGGHEPGLRVAPERWKTAVREFSARCNLL